MSFGGGTFGGFGQNNNQQQQSTGFGGFGQSNNNNALGTCQSCDFKASSKHC
jgi:nuclear pore complex protein Nup98-Nup96